MRKLILAFLAGAAAAPLAAQTATLVKDINTRSDTAGSLFEHLTAVGGNLFFTTSGQVTGEDLWVSDGTAAGTRDLLHPCPGSCGSGVTFLGSLRKVLLFSEDGAFFGGYQLWRSDGSAPGTFRLAPGVAASGGLAALNALDAAFAFVGCTVTTPPSCGLWRTDGRAEGTVRLKDLGNVQIGEMAVAGRRLFFPVTDHGALSLWSSDGTAAGTSRIKTLSPGLPGNLAAAGPRLLFFVTGSDQKPELWTSDGTSGGTFALQSFSSADLFAPLVTAGGRAYFVADDGVLGQEVWTSDGTPAGTRRVTGFSLDNTFISALQAFGNRVFFIASDGVHGYQIWSTAGTLDSTTAVTTPCTGCNFVNTATELTAAANGLVFPADDGVHGSEPWITDGTAQGTHLIADLCPGDCESIGPDNREMTPTPQGVLFSALDPSGSEDLWRTDGTAAGTVRLSALGAGGRILPDSDRPPIHLEAASLGATLFFGASNAAGPALWATTEHAAARRVAVVGPQGSSSSPYFLTPYGDRLLFFTPPDNSAGGAASAMWITQGTEEGMEPFGVGLGYISAAESVQSAGLAFFRLSTTDAGHVLVRSDGTDAGSEILAYPAEPGITVFNGRVFFALPGSTAPEIWSTDGTSAGTRKEFALPDGTPEAGYVSAPGTGLYFITGDVNGSKVWRSDGTLAGTQPLADLPPTFFTLTDYSPAFTRLGSRVLFVAPGNSVRSTDGTPAGTVALTNGGVPLGQTYRLVPFNGAVYFFGATAGARGIFRTDGTSAGTVFIQEVPGLTDGTLADAQLVAGGGRLWFTNDDSDHSTELWSSDGTPGGAAMVKDIVPGPDGSYPAWLTFAGGRLFFSADDGVHGVELWQSDGTAAGTRLVQDIAPLASSSAPDRLTVAGDRLYFTADDGPTGRELWSLPLSGAGGCQPSQPSDTALCLGGRYRVEARWRDFAGNAADGHAVPLTADTGTFWFFDPTNVETIVKVLDGRAVNGHVWVFYGALSNVEYTLTVTDTQTGLTRQYYNPPGQLASTGDVYAFGPLGANGANPTPPVAVAAASPLPLISEWQDKAAAVPCQASAEQLCLNGARFGVTVTWKDFQGHTGQGTAAPISGDTGTFWFFSAANIELVVKALDGRPVNGHFWLFFGALSNVQYTVTVTDSVTGAMRKYTNPSGRFASVADTLAF